MPAKDPAERALVARIAAYVRWSQTPDRAAATAPARGARDDRLLRQVDPDGILDPAERDRRAEMARKAYFGLLALRSAQARRARSRTRRREKPMPDGSAIVAAQEE